MSRQGNGAAPNVQYTQAVDQNTANHFPWGTIQWMWSDQHFDGANITFGYVQIEPGCKNPRHYHPNSSEVLFLIEGQLDHSIGEEVHKLTPGTSIFIPTGVEHDARNTGTTTARMVVAYPTGDRQAVMLEQGEDE